MLRPVLKALAIAAFASFACLSANPQPVPATEHRTIRAGYYDAKPSCWCDESGKPQGIFIDTLNLLAEAEGWTVEYVFSEWNELLDGLKTGSIDLVPAIVRTPERETFAVFTEEAVMTDWGEVFAHPDSDVKSILDLDGLRVGALENDFWFSGPGSLKDLCSAFGISPLYVYFSDYSSLFRALDAGSVDAAAASNSLGLVWQPLIRMASTPVLYNPIELRFAASRAKPEGPLLVRDLDLAIQDLETRDPGLLRRILEKHAVPSHREFVIPVWVSIALGILVVVFAISVVVVAQLAARLKSAADGLRLAKDSLEQSLVAKDLLVHELSHRVKNNLQIILSLVSLVDGERDEGDAVSEIREKIYSLSCIEEELHERGAISEASLRSFFDTITRRFNTAYASSSSRFILETDLRQTSLVPSAAIPLALIMSELMSNTIRYGRDPNGHVDATVRIAVNTDGSGEIAVHDHGPGFCDGFDPVKTPGLGYRLIGALVSQLGGTLSTRSNQGAHVSILVPRAGWTERRSG
jgi:two-component sensor histidine kinase/ABC-type amino acid transport substrate-binding protein